MKSLFATSQLTVPNLPALDSSTYGQISEYGHLQQIRSTSQSDEPSTEPLTLLPPIPISPTLLVNARTALNPHHIKREPLLGDPFVWELFLKPLAAGYNVGHSLFDYAPFHAIAPRDLDESEKGSFTRTWIVERLRGIISPQLINVKTGALVCLQDTTPALDPIDPCLPTVWGIVGGLARAEPGYQIHHFVVIAQSSTYPPTQKIEEGSLIAIPTFYLDPDRPRIVLSPPSIRQRHIPGTDLWARPLRMKEKKAEETVEKGVPGMDGNQTIEGWVSHIAPL